MSYVQCFVLCLREEGPGAVTALYFGWPAFCNRHFVILGGGGVRGGPPLYSSLLCIRRIVSELFFLVSSDQFLWSIFSFFTSGDRSGSWVKMGAVQKIGTVLFVPYRYLSEAWALACKAQPHSLKDCSISLSV